MKNLILVMVIVLTISTQAQNFIEPHETVLIAPNTAKFLAQLDYQSSTVRETARKEFSLDPIAFQKRHFNIQEYMNHFKDKNYDTFYVTFKSSNGRLEVQFDKKGKLKRNTQWFTDVDLPVEITQQLHKEHNGWNMIKNKYFSKGREGLTDKTVYRIKLKNGNKTRHVKIIPDLQETIVAAEKQDR